MTRYLAYVAALIAAGIVATVAWEMVERIAMERHDGARDE